MYEIFFIDDYSGDSVSSKEFLIQAAAEEMENNIGIEKPFRMEVSDDLDNILINFEEINTIYLGFFIMY